MAKKHIIYIDESGNSGANLLEASPIFAIAGLAIRESSMARMEGEFKQLNVDYGFSEEEEIKGGRLLRSDKNKLIRDALELVLCEDLPVFSSVIERRFMICPWIVEHFIDPVYNDRIGNELTYPIPEKIMVANYLYDNLSQDTVDFAAAPVITGELTTLVEFHKRVLSEMNKMP